MIGVILLNLGTPQAPTTPAVRRYLREFLSDPRVIDIHPIARFFLVNGIIVPFRSPKSAAAYREVWTEEGSPLLVHSEALTSKVAARLGQSARVVLAMRYGEPSIPAAFEKLEGCARIVVLPLYPQYASSSTGTGLEAVFAAVSDRLVVPSLSVVPPFYSHPAFIRALATVSRPHIQPDDHVLFSYHGLPVHHMPCTPCDQTAPCPAPVGPRANCYRSQCYATTAALVEAMGLSDNWSVSFQSRLGRRPWIQPYTDERLEQLPGEGVKNLAVMCPAFVADCLETLEEIGIRAREQFLAAGGERLTLVPCLNSHDVWVEAVAELIASV
ncbi:MAG: ferrochelatase [Myxococcota bacterium]|jgi:ferrochelatase